MKTNFNRTIEIESRLTKLETKLDEIMINHLPHLSAKLNWILGLFVSALITLIFLLLNKSF
mgnify:CR=1 FL=1